VGTGIVPKLTAGQEIWDRWATGECDADGRHDFYGQQALAARTIFESGEVLIRLRWRNPEDGFTIPLQLQIMEPDFIDTAKTGQLGGGGYIDSGIQFDALGRRVGYWLFDQHPGANVRFGGSSVSRLVSADDIIHVYECQRPGQSRGVPRLAPVLMKLRDLDDYEEAELLRKGIEACFAAFVETDNNDFFAGSEASASSSSVMDESIAAGMIKYLRPGEKITFGSPAAVQGYNEFIRQQLHAVSAGSGITYEMQTGDLSQVNYSSMRGGKLEFQRGAEVFQWLTFIPQYCRPIESAFRRASIIAGAGRVGKAQFEWTPPKWDWVDPLKDASGVILELAAGLTSWEEEARRRGWTAEKLLAQIKANQEAFKAAGITLQWDKLVLGALAAAASDQQTNENAHA
jgi:lambda family phage portal protein